MNIKILAAVSGGKDSMFMLKKLMEQDDADVAVAHFNHKMRGPESDRDEEFVRKFCERNGLEFIRGEGKDIKSEEEAREQRYAFLEKAAEELGCDFIATAHTRSDNAETVLLNLIRGSGARGLSGIPAIRGNIIRPILGMDSEETEHVEDSSNSTDDYSRNIIRHKVMPVLEEINPAAEENIARAAALIAEDDMYLTSLADEMFTDRAAEIAELPRPIASRIIRKICGNISNEHMEMVYSILEGSEYRELDLPGLKLIKDRGILKKAGPAKKYSVDFARCKASVNNELNTCFIKSASIVGELRATTRLDGDRLRVAGRNCSKTLKSLFLENNVPNEIRDSIPVIRDDAGILYVYNLALAERAVCAPGDDAVKVTVKELQ